LVGVAGCLGVGCCGRGQAAADLQAAVSLDDEDEDAAEQLAEVAAELGAARLTRLLRRAVRAGTEGTEGTGLPLCATIAHRHRRETPEACVFATRGAR
jgi:hypothetical protein